MGRRKSKKSFWPGLLIIIALAALWYFDPGLFNEIFPASTPTPTPAVLSVTQSPAIGVRTKITGCVSDGVLPDPACNPGSIDPKVTQANIQSTICVSGYSSGVRPSSYTTDKIKVAQFEAYGINAPMDQYELDHLVSLELGGSPEDVANLWPEPYDNPMGAHEKDKVENYLHKEVCNGTITLHQAQVEIATDWTAVYKEVYGQ